MKQNKRRVLSALMVFAMLVSLLPTAVFAAVEKDAQLVAISVSSDENGSVTISAEQGLYDAGGSVYDIVDDTVVVHSVSGDTVEAIDGDTTATAESPANVYAIVGDTVIVTVTPASDEYELDTLTVGDEEVTVEGDTYTFTVEAAAKIEVTFKEKTEVAVTLDQPTLSLKVGDDPVTLTATVTGAENTNVTWSSDTETVATVDENGAVTAVAAGTAKITATSVADKTKKAECTVTVTADGEQPQPGDEANIPVTITTTGEGTVSVKAGETDVNNGDKVKAGDVLTIAVTGTAEGATVKVEVNGTELTGDSYTYEVKAEDTEIAIVVTINKADDQPEQPTGIPVTVSKTGTGTVTLTVNGEAKESDVYVNADDTIVIAVDPKDATVTVNDAPATAVEGTEGSYTYTVSGEEEAIVIGVAFADITEEDVVNTTADQLHPATVKFESVPEHPEIAFTVACDVTAVVYYETVDGTLKRLEVIEVTDANGNKIYGFAAPTDMKVGSKIQIGIMGDLSGDGRVMAADAAVVLTFSVRAADAAEDSTLPDDLIRVKGDTNADGRVLAADASAILSASVELAQLDW